MSLLSFEAATTVQPSLSSPNTYSAEVRDGWQQGRGAFGGLVFGLLARAMQATENSDRSLRALTGEIPSPVMTGRCEIEVATIRRVSGVSSHSATLKQGDAVIAKASSVFGKARQVSNSTEDVTTLPTHPGQEIPVDAPLPSFARNMRFAVTGPLPFSGEKSPIVEGWVELRNSSNRLSAIDVIGLADAYWPALFTVSPGPRPCATVSFFIHLNPGRIAAVSSQRVFCKNQMLSSSQGFFVEERRIFNEDGQLLALNTQTFVIIR